MQRSLPFAGLLGVPLALFTAGTPGTTTAATTTTLATFSTPGTFSWTVPAGVTKITVLAFGGSGGNVIYTAPGPTLVAYSRGGAGGEARGTHAVKPGETFEIVVGGQGGTVNSTTTGGAAGFNGGGAGQGSDGAGSGTGAGGGGGASDVRIGGVGNTCAANRSCAFSDRIIVAGGGGGGGNDASQPGGGAGGGASGLASQSGEPGGGQELANPCSPQDPSCPAYGQFGTGETGSGGGGGGGWYGGSTLEPLAIGGDGGGGGSGYMTALMTAGSLTAGAHAGDGEVVILTP